jgi:hypothetical protein
MKNTDDRSRIHHFLSVAGPIVIELLTRILRLDGLATKVEGRGLDTILAFRDPMTNNEVKLCLHNLLLEIATVDRDEEPLRFDDRLNDFAFFLSKSIHHINSKLEVLFRLIGRKNIQEAISGVEELAAKYERIRILRLDRDSFGECQAEHEEPHDDQDG